MSTPRTRVEVPRAFQPLLAPRRYKAAYGGRGAAKSHFFAEQLLLRCGQSETRAVCIREIQNSLKDSVRQLLVDKIEKLGVGRFFDVLDAEIRGRNGSLIVFRGMQSYNAENIKSLESFDVAWVEEAQSLSETSLRLLRPTLRKETSELWFSWNPRFESDPVDAFFRANPPPADMATIVRANWRDNPWFPEILRREMEADYAKDPEVAEHVWGGGYQTIGEGSYYGRLLALAQSEGRIGLAPYDPAALVTTAWDLGFGDDTAIWFAQIIGAETRLIDFYENRGVALDHYAKVLRDKPYAYFRHLLPHDGSKGELIAGTHIVDHAKKTLPGGSSAVEILPRVSVEDGINAARVLIPKCRFDETKCAAGLKALRNYRREWKEDLGVYSDKPLHDWTSHAADAFRYLAMGLKAPPKPRSPSGGGGQPGGWMS